MERYASQALSALQPLVPVTYPQQDNERTLTSCNQVADAQKALQRCAKSFGKAVLAMEEVTVLGRCVTSRLHAIPTAESVEELVVYLDKGMPSMNR